MFSENKNKFSQDSFHITPTMADLYIHRTELFIWKVFSHIRLVMSTTVCLLFSSLLAVIGFLLSQDVLVSPVVASKYYEYFPVIIVQQG